MQQINVASLLETISHAFGVTYDRGGHEFYSIWNIAQNIEIGIHLKGFSMSIVSWNMGDYPSIYV